MQSELQITMDSITHSANLDARIRTCAARLEKLFPRLTACRVLVAEPNHHDSGRKLFRVRLNVAFPGGEVVVSRDNHEDVYVLLREAFLAARRELERSARRYSDGAKLHAKQRALQLF